jgi:alkanesulfonate monooxygenase SsuD/methylene tetrahydromethanopterin reductase-like flavin-dependent oxidoreductase (luciferase family)
VRIIRQLWNGENVFEDGLVKVENARLFTLPEKPPLLFGAAITDSTAEWVGSWADGLLTVAKPPDELEGFARIGNWTSKLSICTTLPRENQSR